MSNHGRSDEINLPYPLTPSCPHTENATRFCHYNGSWEQYTNYDACAHLPAPETVPEFETIVELPTIIYYIGYALSLVSLTLALIVFAYYK